MKRIVIMAFVLFTCGLVANAQVNNELKNATWVRIMQNDTSINYFVAKSDFAKFKAKHRKKEVEQQDKEKATAKNGERLPNEEHLQDPEQAAIMAFQQWSKSIRPFVDSSGRVMPIEQRMAIVNKRK